MKGNKIITKTVFLLSLVSLFTDVASEMLYPVMPLFLRSVGFSILLIGILEGLAEATAGLSKGYFGQMSDRLGTRAPFVRWGYGLSAVSKPMMVLFSYPWWIFFARTADRLGKGVRTGARDAMLSDEATEANKGKVFGFHRGMDTLGAAIGPAIALLFLWYMPGQYKPLFLLAFIPGVLAVALSLLLKEKKRPEMPRGNARPAGRGIFGYLAYWKKAPLNYRRLVAGLLVFTLFNSTDAFLLLRTREQLNSETQMIGFYIFYNLVFALAAYPLGRLADKVGLINVLTGGLMFFVLVYFFFGFATARLHFILLFLGYAVYAAATEGISKALISNCVSREETATAIGFFTSFASIATMIASAVGGLIWQLCSAKAMFIVAATGVAISAVYLALCFRDTKMAFKGFYSKRRP